MTVSVLNINTLILRPDAEYMSTGRPLLTKLFHSLPEALKAVIRSTLTHSEILLLMKFYYGKENILREKGWFEGERQGLPVNSQNDPIPWYPYAMVDFLDSRLSTEHRVFEFGGGYSTVWYCDRVSEVVAAEHSSEWADRLSNMIPSNGTIVYRSDIDEYCNEIKNHGRFDFIAIDGIHRTDCVQPALNTVTDSGVILWDDSERLGSDQFEMLERSGFQSIIFSGLKPLTSKYKSTSLFYRDNNCLEI